MPSPSPGCTSSPLGSGRKPNFCGSADGLCSVRVSTFCPLSGHEPKASELTERFSELGSSGLLGRCSSSLGVVSCVRSVNETGRTCSGTPTTMGISSTLFSFFLDAHRVRRSSLARNLRETVNEERACT